MVKTTAEELGEAYQRALIDICQGDYPLSPRSVGAALVERYGLYHCYETQLFGGEPKCWIEFPDDRDYTAFMLRWS